MSLGPQPALTAARSDTLRAVVARILPGSDGPGAARTGTADAVERALQHASLRGLRPGVEAFLDRVQAQAEKAHSRAFQACDAEQQDELLRGFEQDSGWPRLVFRALIGLSLEGLLGDPVHGGNRDFAGWLAAGLKPEDVRAGFCRGLGGA